jgi:hypothetical protein
LVEYNDQLLRGLRVLTLDIMGRSQSLTKLAQLHEHRQCCGAARRDLHNVPVK